MALAVDVEQYREWAEERAVIVTELKVTAAMLGNAGVMTALDLNFSFGEESDD